MKTLLAAGAAALLAGCATTPWSPASDRGNLELQGIEPKTGGHCESSAMLNALSYLGYGVSESDIVGGGAAPSFMLTNEGFPFIGSRNATMRETFLAAASIPYKVIVPANAAEAWDGVFGLLGRGLPVLLRVDMRYLPYLYNGKYGPSYMSFGWHYVCLFGVDLEKGEALVTDTALEGLQRIRLADLDKARSSSTKVWPPRREYAWVEAKSAGWSLDADALARSAIAGVLSNYEGTGGGDSTGVAASASGTAPAAGAAPRGAKAADRAPLLGLDGLGRFPGFLERIDESVNPQALAPAYSYMSATIEKNGTGGSAFRRLFCEFLTDRSADCADPGLRTACAALRGPAAKAAEAWSALAASFDEAAAAIQAARGSQARAEAIAAAKRGTAAAAHALYVAEADLRDALASAHGVSTDPR